MPIEIPDLTKLLNDNSSEQILNELKLLRGAVVSAVHAFGTEEQISKFNEHVRTYNASKS